MNAYLSTAKEYRNLERQIALGSKPGVFRRLFGGAKAKVQNLANKMYARKKLAPINYKLSIGWKQHVMDLLRKQQAAQQKVDKLEKNWQSWRRVGSLPSPNAINKYRLNFNAAQKNLEEAKRLVKNARKQKVLTLGSTEYTKKGATPVVSTVPVVKRSNLNNNIQRLVFIASKNPPKLNKVLNDEFNRLFPFRPENNRVQMRKKLYGYASMKGVPWSVQKAATRRAIKSGRAAISHNQEQARKNAEARMKPNAIRRMKEALNNKNARENAAKRVKKNYTPSLNTIKENNNLNSHPLVNNNSNSNNNFHNASQNFNNNKAYPLPLAGNAQLKAYPLPLAVEVANNAAMTRAKLLLEETAPRSSSLLREAAPRSSGLLQVASEPKPKTLRERVAILVRSRKAKRAARHREAALGNLPIFPRYNLGGRAIV